MCGGYKGLRDYGIVIELLRGNLVEPVTPPTHHVSPLNILSSSAVIHTAVLFLILLYCTTVEPLNKGHLRTEGIVPYSEVVPYWEIFQKK